MLYFILKRNAFTHFAAVKKLMKMADTDGDGKVSQAELTTLAHGRFSKHLDLIKVISAMNAHPADS